MLPKATLEVPVQGAPAEESRVNSVKPWLYVPPSLMLAAVELVDWIAKYKLSIYIVRPEPAALGWRIINRGAVTVLDGVAIIQLTLTYEEVKVCVL